MIKIMTIVLKDLTSFDQHIACGGALVLIASTARMGCCGMLSMHKLGVPA
jgi:hypothetical protein